MRALTDQVIAVLKAGALTVGDGVGNTKVDGSGVALTPPFVVVYPLVQTRDGSLEDAWSDVDKWFQITGEGVRRDQAEWLGDRVEELLIASDLVVVELTRTEAARDDSTGADSRFKTHVRARIRAYA